MATRAETRDSEEQRRNESKNRAARVTPGTGKAEETRRRKLAEHSRVGTARAREHAEIAAARKAHKSSPRRGA